MVESQRDTITEYHLIQYLYNTIIKSTENFFKEFCKGLPTTVGQQRKFCFLEHLKRLFHYSVNTYLT